MLTEDIFNGTGPCRAGDQVQVGVTPIRKRRPVRVDCQSPVSEFQDPQVTRLGELVIKVWPLAAAFGPQQLPSVQKLGAALCAEGMHDQVESFYITSVHLYICTPVHLYIGTLVHVLLVHL